MHRRPLTALLLAVPAALVLAGCSTESVADRWLPKLQQENAFVCRQDVCDTAQRRAALTADLASDADKAGGEYAKVADLAKRANLAYRFWEQDCGPRSSTSFYGSQASISPNAGMSCSAAFDLTLHGTDQLEGLVLGISQSET